MYSRKGKFSQWYIFKGEENRYFTIGAYCLKKMAPNKKVLTVLRTQSYRYTIECHFELKQKLKKLNDKSELVAHLDKEEDEFNLPLFEFLFLQWPNCLKRAISC